MNRWCPPAWDQQKLLASRWQSLTALNLSGCGLAALSSMVGGLGGLLELRLSDNKLTALPVRSTPARAARAGRRNNLLTALPGWAAVICCSCLRFSCSPSLTLHRQGHIRWPLRPSQNAVPPEAFNMLALPTCPLRCVSCCHSRTSCRWAKHTRQQTSAPVTSRPRIIQLILELHYNTHRSGHLGT